MAEVRGMLVADDGSIIYQGDFWVDTKNQRGMQSWLAGYQTEDGEFPPPRKLCNLRLNDGRAGNCFLKGTNGKEVKLRGTGLLA